MPVNRTVTENAVTKYEETRITLTRGPRGLQIGEKERKALRAIANLQPYGFDALIAPVEKAIKPHLTDTLTEPLSQAWYANDIRDRIAAVRILQRQSPSRAAAAALELGCVIVEAHASCTWAPDLALGRTTRLRNRKASRAGVEARRKLVAENNATLLKWVRACQAKHPTIKPFGIATMLLARFGRDSGDRVKDHNALRKRIERLLKKPL